MAAASQTASAYVGRAAELASLEGVLADVVAGGRRVALLGGDAGIGKTRTAIELADRARERGVRVLWGRCPETEGAPEFWPWVQVLRAWLEGQGAGDLRAALGSGAEDIARLVPEIGARLALPEPPPLDASQARFRLFDAVAAWARNLAREAPLLLVLDDLHWADAGSLRLLEFVARDALPAPIGLVGTFREAELTAEHPLARTVAELSRLPGSARLSLRGLAQGELGTYLAGALGMSAAPGVLAQVHERSEGNPFFAAELMRFLLADPRETEPGARHARLPPSVRAVVARRVEQLGPETRAALEAASVIGREFDLPRLEHATGESRLELLARLEPALSAGVVESAGGAAGRYRFAHALVRESLYEGLALTRRLELHQRVGKAIEALHAADREEHLAELAYHFCAAAALGHAEHAVAYAERAAARASDHLAFEDAAHLYGRALEALALGDATPARRCDLLLRRGTAEHRAGDVRASSETFAEALAIARALGDGERTVRAILGPGWWLGDIFATPDASDAAVLEGAIGALKSDSPLAAEAASVLATRLFWEGRLDDADRESARAADVARRAGDARLLARCLDARHWVIGGPDRLAERVALADELLALAERSGDVEMQCAAHRWRAGNALEQGDRVGFERSALACASLAERTRQPYFLFQARALHGVDAAVCGRLDDAEQRASASFESALASGNVSGALSMGTLLILVRWLRGDLDGALALAGQGVRRQNPETYVYRATRATLACERGDGADEGRAVLAELTAPGALLRNRNLTGVGVLLTRICERLGAVEHAEPLLELLAPYAERNGTIGLANVLVLSSVASCLGALATLLGRSDEAEHWFERAIEIESRTGSLAWLALTKLRYAALLTRRAGAGDAERARELASDALHAARELGLVQRAREAEAVLASLLDAPPPASLAPTPTPESAAAFARARFRREGDVWSIALDAQMCRLRDAKGLRLLAYLLAHPGQEFHALELAGLGEARGGSAPDEGAVLDAGSAGPQLDARAKAAYRARLEELAAELAEAERFHDPGRVESAQAEIDTITDELARGVGLGGRDRTAASAAERARQAVTHGVRTALRRIRAELPALGEHLAPRIRTGLYCAYVPDPTRPIEWDL